ncbi:hypothetical protein L596_016220 [Steinernema carpocapsae]|uniref:SCP domain-containing protein n=1 Tax=Steinernema carpocapsae TaxID=34508 RepID=A0A4U5NIB2_STECR|nr:hypothetical protein L596_016220 [Steinernema carpocapsae]
MKTQITLALLPILASCFVHPSLELPKHVYENANLVLSSDFVVRCDDILFTKAQSDFNRQISGIPSVQRLTWRKAAELENVVINAMKGTPKTFLKVCEARKKFFRTLRTMWDSCINRYYLLKKLDSTTAQNISAPFIYVQMWDRLDFLCNAGLEVALSNKFYTDTFKNTPAFQYCEKAFLDALNSDGTNFCSPAQTFLDCTDKAFQDYDDKLIAGWFVCENVRAGYTPDCPNLRCYVYKPSIH